MHLPPLFKAVHAGHHRSLTPTPWSILSFQPLETISQFGFFALVIFFVPLHPATLLAYLLFDGEGHGFRQAANITRALEAELYFYSRIFGFTPGETVAPIEIENL